MKSSCTNSNSSMDVSVISSSEEDEDSVFLLGSWKSFLVIVSKDNPVVSLSPKVCSRIIDSILTSIRAQMASLEPHVRLMTSLSEVGLVLMQRWHTKCAGESMASWLNNIGGILGEFSGVFESLHPRARLALLAMATAALKISAFKLTPDTESNILAESWLPSTCGLVEKALSTGTAINSTLVIFT